MFILRKFDRNPGSRYHRVGKRRWIFENWERRSSSSSRGGTNVSSLFGRGKKRLVAMSRAKTISIGTERNETSWSKGIRKNEIPTSASRCGRSAKRGKEKVQQLKQCLALSRLSRSNGGVDAVDDHLSRQQCRLVLLLSRTYILLPRIYIYIFDLSSLLVQRSNESRIVFREILLPPHPGHVESVITVLARAENSRTGWNVSAESRIAGKKKEEDWCERGWERERESGRGASRPFSRPFVGVLRVISSHYILSNVIEFPRVARSISTAFSSFVANK